MRKIVKRWGNSLVLVLDTEDTKAYEIEEDDILEIELKRIGKGGGKNEEEES